MATMTRSQFHRAMLSAAAVLPFAAQSQAQSQLTGSITDVPGIRVGHFTDRRRPTGVTVLLFDAQGAATGVDFDGSAPGTYQVSLLQPVSFIQEIWGIVLSGGSSFGLATVPGAARYLEEQKIGLKFGVGLVPIVVGAIIYDLEIGDSSVRPDAEAAYQACKVATVKNVAQGNVGAGAGATVGKMLGQFGMRGMKSGVGMASMRVGDVIIGALMVVNAAGNIVDWKTGKVIAGTRRPDGKGLESIPEILENPPARASGRAAIHPVAQDPVFQSTTIGVVATNATFNKTEMTKIAMMANCGAARCINPYHTPGDGDTLFAASTRRVKSDLSLSVVGTLAAEVVSEAIIQSAKMATSIPDWPAYRDYTAKL
jgi:L-aminopeptidase/D-esterase-like protein